MLLEELCKIARCGGNCRLVVSYAGEDRYAVGISDGVTTAAVYRGTQPELEVKLREQLPQYPETIAREARERKEKEDAARHEAEVKAAERELKRQASVRRSAEKNDTRQEELSLF